MIKGLVSAIALATVLVATPVKADIYIPSGPSVEDARLLDKYGIEPAALGMYGGLIGFTAFTHSTAGGSLLTSVQEFTITIAGGSTSNTATISSVSTSTAMIVWAGSTAPSTTTADPSTCWGRLTLTDSTTVTFVRNTSHATETLVVSGYVVEWTSAACSNVQYGTVSIAAGSTSNTATITSVTTTNSLVQFLGVTSSGTSVDLGRTYARHSITSATQVTATRTTSTTANIVTSFVVMSFNGSILNSSTQETTTTATGTSDTNTITSVTTGQTWLAYGGQQGGYSASSNGQYTLNTVLTNGTTVTSTCQTSHTWSVTVTAVEFKASDVQLIQRSEVTVSDASLVYEDETVTAVTLAKAWVNHIGEYLAAGSSASPRFVRTYANMTSTTNKRFTRGTASATVTPKVSSELIELI